MDIYKKWIREIEKAVEIKIFQKNLIVGISNNIHIKIQCFVLWFFFAKQKVLYGLFFYKKCLFIFYVSSESFKY